MSTEELNWLGEVEDENKRLKSELAATKARLEVATVAFQEIVDEVNERQKHFKSDHSYFKVVALKALATLDAPAADTDAKPPLPSVVGARNLKVCRICGNKISTQGWPVGAAEDFGELIFPEKVTLNFGYEFAHTACLAADTGGKESV